MAVFTDIDLSKLEAPDAVEALDFETIYAEVVQLFLDKWQEKVTADPSLPAITTLNLESDPLASVLEVFAYREMLLRIRVNESVRSVLLATATGNNLDHLGAYLGVERLVLVPADATASPPTVAVLESDTAFRRRIQLAPEALSVAGPEGAYLALALATTDDTSALIVKSAAVHSVDDRFAAAPSTYRVVAAADVVSEMAAGATDEWIIDDGVGAAPRRYRLPAGHVHVVVVSAAGDGQADASVISSVDAALSASAVRPIGDYVHVVPAEIVNYTIDVTLTLGSGADTDTVKSLAEERLAAFVDRQHAVGGEVTRLMVASVASVSGTDGLPVAGRIVVTEPAADVTPGPFSAPYCTAIVVTTEVADE